MEPIGIRREDKNPWERRAPLTPEAVARLVGRGWRVKVQSCSRRIFADAEYAAAGAEVTGDLAGCRTVFGVKEIPVSDLAADRTYAFFSHTVKGQPYNMPMLRRILELGATLVDYERIADARGRRLVSFSRFAGLAGMIDALWALGRRWAARGWTTPFAGLEQAIAYRDLAAALGAVGEAGARLEQEPSDTPRPIVVAFVGDGRSSRGAQEALEALRPHWVDPDDLPAVASAPAGRPPVVGTVIRKHHALRRRDGGPFDASEYRDHPERFTSRLPELLPHITVLVNAIYWEPGQPVLLDRDALARLWKDAHRPRLEVIADISCDIGGPLACTVRATTPGDPTYLFDPATGTTRAGLDGPGPLVLAVDNLPCELPLDASRAFSEALGPFVEPIACLARVPGPDDPSVPREIARAIIAFRGSLTPDYRYLESSLERHAPSRGPHA